jgi:hypothetical protein
MVEGADAVARHGGMLELIPTSKKRVVMMQKKKKR